MWRFRTDRQHSITATPVIAIATSAMNSPRRLRKKPAPAAGSWRSAVGTAGFVAVLLVVALGVLEATSLRGAWRFPLLVARSELSDPNRVNDAAQLLKRTATASSSSSTIRGSVAATTRTTSADLNGKTKANPEKGIPLPSSSNAVKLPDSSTPPDVTKLDSYIKRRSGGGDKARWEVWDGSTVLHPEHGQEAPCRWEAYRPPNSGKKQTSTPGRMCLYPDGRDQFVSETIAEKGHWEDCDDLTESLMRGDDKSRTSVYVDIGTNIGACVMQVLLTTDASVVAFEPSPPNLFRLTSTLLSLPRHVRNRVALFPVALGDATGTVSIMANPRNSGNTQVRRSDGEKGVDGASQETRDIPVERIDDLLSPKLHIDLVK
jgi:FkbM family methyltransferase